MEGYLTTKEACKKYSICKRTLYRWADTGRIEKYKDQSNGRIYFVPPKHDLIPIEKVQDILRCSRATIYRLIFKGDLHPVPGKTKTWFLSEDIALYLAGKTASILKVPSAQEMVEAIGSGATRS